MSSNLLIIRKLPHSLECFPECQLILWLFTSYIRVCIYMFKSKYIFICLFTYIWVNYQNKNTNLNLPAMQLPLKVHDIPIEKEKHDFQGSVVVIIRPDRRAPAWLIFVASSVVTCDATATGPSDAGAKGTRPMAMIYG